MSVVAYEWVAVSLDTSAVPVWTVHDATSASRAVCADAFLRFESEGVDKKTNPRFLLILRSGATRAAVNLSLGPTHGPAHASVLVDGAERSNLSRRSPSSKTKGGPFHLTTILKQVEVH